MVRFYALLYTPLIKIWYFSIPPSPSITTWRIASSSRTAQGPEDSGQESEAKRRVSQVRYSRLPSHNASQVLAIFENAMNRSVKNCYCFADLDSSSHRYVPDWSVSTGHMMVAIEAITNLLLITLLGFPRLQCRISVWTNQSRGLLRESSTEEKWTKTGR